MNVFWLFAFSQQATFYLLTSDLCLQIKSRLKLTSSNTENIARKKSLQLSSANLLHLNIVGFPCLAKKGGVKKMIWVVQGAKPPEKIFAFFEHFSKGNPYENQ